MSSTTLTTSTPERVVSIAEDELGEEGGRGLIIKAQAEIERVARMRGLAIDGFFSTSARSIVVLAYDKSSGSRYVLKAPISNLDMVSSVMECYARAGIGPLSLRSGDVIVSEYIEDNQSFFAEGSLEDFSAKRLFSRLTKCQYELDDDPITFEEKMTQVLSDARRRAEHFGGDDAREIVGSLKYDIEELVELSRGVDDFVCHGDLHYKNILRNHGRPLVIDPDPHLGPRETDVVALCSSLGVRHERTILDLDLDMEVADTARRIYEADRKLYQMFRKSSPVPKPIGQASRYLIAGLAKRIESEKSPF